MTTLSRDGAFDVLGVHASFILGDNEFALPVEYIQEVVNEPLEYNAIPLTPDHVLGLFDLRGTILPAIDLDIFFERSISNSSKKTDRKLVIVEHGELSFGLLFDATGTVFNAANTELSLFKASKPSAEPQAIRGVFNMGADQPMVQLIDIAALLEREDITTIVGKVSSSLHTSRGVRHQCISFHVGNSLYGLNINSIKEIVPFNTTDNPPLISEICLGTIDIRETTIPIIDFGRVLGNPARKRERESENPQRHALVLAEDGFTFGLHVDSIENIVTYYESDVIPVPMSGDTTTRLFFGCLANEDGRAETVLLDSQKIFANNAINKISQSCSRLFNEAKKPSLNKSNSAVNRSSLITFTLDSHYGLNITEVQEIIDVPTDLVSPPCTSYYVEGLFNLRGVMVNVIDSKRLYPTKCGDEKKHGKLLVYEFDGETYGLSVASVDAIVHFSWSDTIEMPSHLINSANDKDWKMGRAVDRALTVDNKSIGILDLESITQRVRSEI